MLFRSQLEDLVRQLAETFRRNKALKAERKQKAPPSSRRKHQRKGGPLKDTNVANESFHIRLPPRKDPGCVEDPPTNSPHSENVISEATLPAGPDDEASAVQRPPALSGTPEFGPPAL